MTEATDQPEAAHVVIDKDSTARINIGILVSIIASTVVGAWYLQGIAYAVSAANITLEDVKDELEKQNDALRRNSETLIRHGVQIQTLETRVGDLEGP